MLIFNNIIGFIQISNLISDLRIYKNLCKEIQELQLEYNQVEQDIKVLKEDQERLSSKEAKIREIESKLKSLMIDSKTQKQNITNTIEIK